MKKIIVMVTFNESCNWAFIKNWRGRKVLPLLILDTVKYSGE